MNINILLTMVLLPLVADAVTFTTQSHLRQQVNECLKVDPTGQNTRETKCDMQTWNVSLVTDMNRLFDNQEEFDADISGWDVSSVTNMYAMFHTASAFNQPIGQWDVSSVQRMDHMFFKAKKFNGDIGSWDVSHATTMGSMFVSADAFNQQVGRWDVSSVTNMGSLFRKVSPSSNDMAFNQPIGQWNVSNVIQMDNMFHDANAFNQPIGEWDVSKATHMEYMFNNAQSFNQPIGQWDVSNVRFTSSMFDGATTFDQTLCGPEWYKIVSGERNKNVDFGTLPTDFDCNAGIECGAGSYRIAQDECINCAAGKWSNIEGATNVTTSNDCGAGTYAATTGLSECDACAAGTASASVGALNANTCISCAEGTYAATTGLSECDACAAGNYSQNATLCVACNATLGYYDLDANASTPCEHRTNYVQNEIKRFTVHFDVANFKQMVKASMTNGTCNATTIIEIDLSQAQTFTKAR